MKWKFHVRCGAGEKLEIISKTYLSLFDCILWDSVAASTVKYCNKGDIVGIKGRIQSRLIEKDTTKQRVMEIIAEKVTFLSSNKNNDEEVSN